MSRLLLVFIRKKAIGTIYIPLIVFRTTTTLSAANVLFYLHYSMRMDVSSFTILILYIYKASGEREMLIEWKTELLTPIYKKGNRIVCEIYAGTALQF